MTVKGLGRDSAVVEIGAYGERKSMRKHICSVAVAALGISLSAAAQEPRTFSGAPSDGVFDPPIRTETVDPGESPYFPDGADSPGTALSCHYFPDFMVKEYYLGGKGAEWLSILHTPGAAPQCTSSHAAGERVIEYPEWEGYFAGVKGRLVFFNGSDSFDGGLPIAVYDSLTGTKIFEDSADYRASSSSHVDVVSTSEAYVLRYRRVVATSCDLNSEGTPCWNRIRAEHALPGADMPRCTGYERIAEQPGTDRVESVIAYAVEVTLSARPSVQSLAGPVDCWPTH